MTYVYVIEDLNEEDGKRNVNGAWERMKSNESNLISKLYYDGKRGVAMQWHVAT